MTRPNMVRVVDGFVQMPGRRALEYLRFDDVLDEVFDDVKDESH